MCHLMDFAVQEDHWVKIKESEKSVNTKTYLEILNKIEECKVDSGTNKKKETWKKISWNLGKIWDSPDNMDLVKFCK